jgi:hypothetical protein
MALLKKRWKGDEDEEEDVRGYWVNNEARRCWKLKEAALDCSVWKTCVGHNCLIFGEECVEEQWNSNAAQYELFVVFVCLFVFLVLQPIVVVFSTAQ